MTDAWFELPSGRKVDGPDDDVVAVVHALPQATERTLEIARNTWIEADASDFEYVAKRTWRDRASGELFRRCRGNPLAASSEGDVSCWFELDGHLIFLARADTPEKSESLRLGSVGARRGARPQTSPGPRLLPSGFELDGPTESTSEKADRVLTEHGVR
jgi:hypothetical protein